MFSTAFLDLPPLATAGGQLTLPGSKSISNRVLLLSALCAGETTRAVSVSSRASRSNLKSCSTGNASG